MSTNKLKYQLLYSMNIYVATSLVATYAVSIVTVVREKFTIGNFHVIKVHDKKCIRFLG